MTSITTTPTTSPHGGGTFQAASFTSTSTFRDQGCMKNDDGGCGGASSAPLPPKGLGTLSLSSATLSIPGSAAAMLIPHPLRHPSSTSSCFSNRCGGTCSRGNSNSRHNNNNRSRSFRGSASCFSASSQLRSIKPRSCPSSPYGSVVDIGRFQLSTFSALSEVKPNNDVGVVVSSPKYGPQKKNTSSSASQEVVEEVVCSDLQNPLTANNNRDVDQAPPVTAIKTTKKNTYQAPCTTPNLVPARMMPAVSMPPSSAIAAFGRPPLAPPPCRFGMFSKHHHLHLKPCPPSVNCGLHEPPLPVLQHYDTLSEYGDAFDSTPTASSTISTHQTPPSSIADHQSSFEPPSAPMLSTSVLTRVTNTTGNTQWNNNNAVHCIGNNNKKILPVPRLVSTTTIGATATTPPPLPYAIASLSRAQSIDELQLNSPQQYSKHPHLNLCENDDDDVLVTNQSHQYTTPQLQQATSPPPPTIMTMLHPTPLPMTRKLLVLGLNGVVLRAWNKSKQQYGPPVSATHYPDAELLIHSHGPQQTSETINIYYRPHIAHFIGTVAQHFDIAIFSSGEQDYVDALLDVMDPSGQVFPKSRRYYRQHCTKVVSHQTSDASARRSATFLAKDLQILGRPLNEVVLIDDTTHSGALQPSNLLLIPTWTGDLSDTILAQLADRLVHIAKTQNM